MNTMLADSLSWIADELEAALERGLDRPAAVAAVLKDLMEAHGDVVFGGDGYSSDWHTEAVEERGLRNIPTTADALPELISEPVKELFSRTGVLSEAELESRYEVYAEQYVLSIAVEAKIVVDLARTVLYPATMGYLSELLGTITSAAATGIELDRGVATTIATEADAMVRAVADLESALAVDDFESVEKHMRHCADILRDRMDAVRSHADALEGLVADEAWPLPKYREMLFIR